jgi:hypothetical protein
MTKLFHPRLILISASLSLSLATAGAQPTNVVANSPAPLVVAHTQLPVYHPPEISGGILPLRVGGGSRGANGDGIAIEVLVPDHIALTTREQPSLYWYQSKAAKTLCEVTLTQPKKAKPLLVLRSATPTEPGIHSIRLADFKVKLTPNIIYKWSVAVVLDPANRSEDIIANGIIEFVTPSPQVAAQLGEATDANRAAIYADAGIWYDALDSLSDLIEKNPGNQTLQDQRSQLLTQVGLDGAKIGKSAFNQ